MSVAEVVKEVYRDLLSANDKAFTREQRDRDSPSRDLGYGANYGSKIPQFKGLLSVGVEEKTNVVVVSAPDFLMGEVMGLVREVDETAAGHRVKVVKLNGVGAEYTAPSVLADARRHGVGPRHRLKPIGDYFAAATGSAFARKPRQRSIGK